MEQWTNMNQEFTQWTNSKLGGPPSNLAAISSNYNFSHKTLTAWKVEKTTAHQRLIVKVQKLIETLFQAQNYPFLSKYMNCISWPSPFYVWLCPMFQFTDFVERMWGKKCVTDGMCQDTLAYCMKETTRTFLYTSHRWHRYHVHSYRYLLSSCRYAYLT